MSRSAVVRPILAATVLVAATGLVAAAPASAGCETRGNFQYCDQPVKPDGTWDRCRISFGHGVSGIGDYQPTRMQCYPVDPTQLWWGGSPQYHVDP